MALCRPVSHSLANLISLISLANGGEGHGLCNRNVLVNFRNLNPKHRHNACRLAVSRTPRTSRVSGTSGSSANEKVDVNDGSKGEGEGTENYKEQTLKVSASLTAAEDGGEYKNLEGENKKRRRRRRTKAEIEADIKVKTVEDFFRELDAIGESFEPEKSDVGSSSQTPALAVEDSSRISGVNGAVKSEAKRKPRSKKMEVAENALPHNRRTPVSVAPDGSELVGAEVHEEEGSDAVGRFAQKHHEHVHVQGENESKTTSSDGRKPSSRKKRPGRRERVVLAQEAAESCKREPSPSGDGNEVEHLNGTPSYRRLFKAGPETNESPFDGSHDNSAGLLPQNVKYVETNVDVSLTVEDSAGGSMKSGKYVKTNVDDEPVSLTMKDSTKSSLLDTVISIPVENYEQEKPIANYEPVDSEFRNTKSPDVAADSGSGEVFGSNGEEIPTENMEETVIPIRKSGVKRRRQRRRRASPDMVSGGGIGGQDAPVESETNSDDGLLFQENVFEPITWCTVQFKVQADLETNHRLCVVGANPELGAWDLSLALPLLKSQDQDSEKLWENTIKVPQGMMLEYKYFVEAGSEDSSVDRKFGPEIRYFIPRAEGQRTSIEVIKDSWRPESPVKLHSLSWGSRWWEQVDLSDSATEVETETSADSSRRLEETRADSSEVDSLLESGTLVGVLEDVGAGPALTGEGEKSISGHEKVKGPDEWLRRKIRRKVLPREEPWLIESMIMAQRNDSQQKVEEKEEAKVDTGEAADVEQKKELPPVQVEILINSPQCTMQRMAILEDGKLVELLLEPVNTRVQVGNVYLGVVRQLLPGMSGVFVDIGGFQLALLDITRNQYPYTFPNLGGGTSNGSVADTFGHDSTFEEDVSDDEDASSSDDGEYSADVDEDASGSHVGDEELTEDIGDEVGNENDYIVDDLRIKEGLREGANGQSIIRSETHSPGSINVNFGRKLKKWRKLEEGMQIIVQVKKEALGKKGPRLTAFPSLAGRFWVLVPRGRTVGVSRRITGPERRRLRSLAMELQPPSFGLTVRTEALGHAREELERDLARLLETWKDILDLAASSAVTAEHDAEGPAPVLLHRAMGQTLTIVRDFFNTKVHRMVIDSPQCFQEVTSYLQEVAPNLCDRVELYTGVQPIFDVYNVETEIDKFSNKRVNLPNGGYLILEETEALVSIDVNGGTGMLAQDISQVEAILEVNLAAARQIAVEIRLRDIGGIIVVDFIDMDDPSHHKLVYDEMRKAIQRDRSTLNLSEISEFGLMEMTRKRVRPSVTLTISEPCPLCHGVGRVEAHETTLSRIERAIRRSLATKPVQADPSDSAKWPQFLLRVDPVMGEYLKARKRKRITQLSAALKVWLTLKVAVEFSCGYFQVLEQRGQYEKRANVTGQNRGNAGAVPAVGLLSKRVWPAKRRRNFGQQVYNKDSSESNELS